ncbi:MAG: hypothetical protein ACE5IC_04085 [Candidatus Brocadiales bacterium]
MKLGIIFESLLGILTRLRAFKPKFKLQTGRHAPTKRPLKCCDLNKPSVKIYERR